MGRYARKKGKAASCKGIGRRGGKTKTKTRDLDQIHDDLNDIVVEHDVNSRRDDADVLYCVHCARFFQSAHNMTKHLASKVHKQRIKKLKDWPTTNDY